MPANEEVHAFAVKWSDKFRDSKTVPPEIEDPAFADACFSLCFKMDCGKAFMSAYPDTDAFHDYRELNKIVDHISDTQLLGSAIFSRWRYFTHWAGPGDDILAFENRSWFVTALGRLERLTANNKTSSPIFNGCAREVQIISNNLGSGSPPSPEDEMEQHLAIRADGSVFFSAYAYGDGTNHVRTRMKSFMLDAERAAHILKMIGDHFSDEYDMELATDVSNWKMTMTSTENKPYHFRGSLCSAYDQELDDISNRIRLNLNMPELLVFDGRANSDRIDRIAIDYHRITKIKPDVIPEGSSREFATWDYSEHFLIGRESETLEHVQKIGSRCQVSQKYQVEGGITALLDDINVDDFLTRTKGNPPDAIVNPLDTRDYSITVDYLYGGRKILTGTYDINELSDGFVDFLQTASHFMRFYGMGEMFDSAVYGKPLRKQTDCIFCNVQFDDYGKTYCYLTDDDSLEVGDSVVVPVGKNYRETVAKIESIEYHSAEDAPFPWDKIKKIVRKHENTEDDHSADGKDTVKPSEETVIMVKDPLAGISADMWRNILGDEYTESALAASLADVWNEVGWLMHEVDDEDCASEVKERYESWCSLQLELIQKVAAILQCECKTPYIKLLTPFMERNGYRDVSGFWVRIEGINRD